ITADPGFALARAARAHALLERGDAAAARASMAAANSLAADLSAREASHVAFFDLLVAGEAEAGLSALHAPLNGWRRAAVSLASQPPLRLCLHIRRATTRYTVTGHGFTHWAS